MCVCRSVCVCVRERGRKDESACEGEKVCVCVTKGRRIKGRVCVRY